MKKILIAAALLLTSITGASANTSTLPDLYHDWFAYYYFAPTPDRFPDYLKWLQAEGAQGLYATDNPSIDKGFLSVIFTANPDKVEGWTHGTEFTSKAKDIIAYAEKPPEPPESKEIKTLADMDIVWGSFYASGNEAYLKKVVDTLDTGTALDGDQKQQDATRAAAAWSLGANMTQHEIVERYLNSESQKRTGPVGDALKHIIENVRKQREAREFGHKEGEFSAVMFVTDPQVAKDEFARAAGGELHFKQMAKATAGDQRTIVILFAGQQLSDDLHADVTYDVKLTDPTGKIYEDKKDLVAVSGKLPTRFRVYFNKEAMFITFDRKDTRGVYQIKVTVKDNVGKKSIPLTDKITFKK